MIHDRLESSVKFLGLVFINSVCIFWNTWLDNLWCTQLLLGNDIPEALQIDMQMNLTIYWAVILFINQLYHSVLLNFIEIFTQPKFLNYYTDIWHWKHSILAVMYEIPYSQENYHGTMLTFWLVNSTSHCKIWYSKNCVCVKTKTANVKSNDSVLPTIYPENRNCPL